MNDQNLPPIGAGGQAGFHKDIEYVASSVFGYRTFGDGHDPHKANNEDHPTGWLYSITMREWTWYDGRNEAKCLRRTGSHNATEMAKTQIHNEEQVPVQRCGCGFWCYWDANRVAATRRAMVGVLEGWGKVIMGPLGFRSQFGRIRALWVPEGYVIEPQMRARYPTIRWYTDLQELFVLWPSTYPHGLGE